MGSHCGQGTQAALFAHAGPPGLSYVENAIGQAQAERLICEIDRAPWRSDLKRRVQHYGYRYDYRAGTARAEDYLGPLPKPFEDLATQLTAQGHFPRPPDQVIVNEYLPGQGISAHIDCQPCFGNTIASLSLLSVCVMQFSRQTTDERFELLLAPLSLLVLRGDARYLWRHAIPARKFDRVGGQKYARARRLSLTFRVMKFS